MVSVDFVVYLLLKGVLSRLFAFYFEFLNILRRSAVVLAKHTHPAAQMGPGQGHNNNYIQPSHEKQP